MSEMYFSVDVETDGPVPGLHSMLSIGITALHPHDRGEDDRLYEVGHFYRTLSPLDGATQHGDTMKWWAGFPEQHMAATRDAQHPSLVMHELDAWVRDCTEERRYSLDEAEPVKRIPIFVAYPAAFDFGFYAYYAHRFVGRSAFGFVALDMASLAMGHNHGEYDNQTKKRWPAEWVQPRDRVAIHHALEDARQQADIFRRMMKTIRG